MKKIQFILSICFFPVFLVSQVHDQKKEPDLVNLITKIIFVRHAEKAESNSQDPDLSDLGLNRAKRLNDFWLILKLMSSMPHHLKERYKPSRCCQKREI